jgi:hypothetical protein
MERVSIDHVHKDVLNRRNIIIKNVRESSNELIDIEVDFLECLFDESNPKSYRELFQTYESKYSQKALEWENKTVNIVRVNTEYFKQHYFPIEG